MVKSLFTACQLACGKADRPGTDPKGFYGAEPRIPVEYLLDHAEAREEYGQGVARAHSAFRRCGAIQRAAEAVVRLLEPPASKPRDCLSPRGARIRTLKLVQRAGRACNPISSLRLSASRDSGVRVELGASLISGGRAGPPRETRGRALRSNTLRELKKIQAREASREAWLALLLLLAIPPQRSNTTSAVRCDEVHDRN